MEYAPLTWSSCPLSYLGLLDRVQRRAERLIKTKAPPAQQPEPLQPLQHRRDVAGLCVIYKIHRQGATHLGALRQPWATPHHHATRDAHTRNQQLAVPFARTETYLRSFLPRYTRLWNSLTQQSEVHLASSLTAFKKSANAWLLSQINV